MHVGDVSLLRSRIMLMSGCVQRDEEMMLVMYGKCMADIFSVAARGQCRVTIIFYS